MRTMIVFLAAVALAANAYGQIAKKDRSPDDVKKYTSILQILEDMPRKPERGDNRMAAETSQRWLDANVKGAMLRIAGEVEKAGHGAVNGHGSTPGVVLDLIGKGKIWHGCDFDFALDAVCDEKSRDALSRLHRGASVVLEGKIERIDVRWDTSILAKASSLAGGIEITLGDCAIVSWKPNPHLQNDASLSKPARATPRRSPLGPGARTH